MQMKKTLLFWLILALAVVAIANIPMVQTAAPTAARESKFMPQRISQPSNQSDELVIPVRLRGVEDLNNPRGGHDGLDIFDSAMFIDSLEGTYPAWTSRDVLLQGNYWHVDDLYPLGGTGNAWWCGDPALAGAGDTGGYFNHWLQYLVLDTVDLSGTTAPQLAFKARWSIETPGGEPAGYNMWDSWNVWVSTNNGTSWSVLNPSSPPYTGTSSFAFGDEFGMGPGIPAYGGNTYANNFVECLFPLTAYAGLSNVLLRVAMCSDPAFCTVDDSTRYGVILDSIRVSDGATVLLSNDGEADQFVATHQESSDSWVYDTDTAWSATHSWHQPIVDNLGGRAIVSYPITVPAGYQQIKLRYWVWCDMPDFEGPDTDTYLEDYYQVLASVGDAVFGVGDTLGYDYAYNSTDQGSPNGNNNSYTGWTRRVHGVNQTTPFMKALGTGATPSTVYVGFFARSDDNSDGGAGGTGLHIDDVELIAVRAQNVDLSTANIVVPYPVTVGLTRPWTFDFVNQGLNGLSPVRGKLQFTRPDGTTLPATGDSTVVSAGALNYQETRTIPRIWANPDMAGAWGLRVIANATGEQDRTNDTTWSPVVQTQNEDSTFAVYVRPAGVYELGYGRRAANSRYLQPRYTHFTPLADGVPSASCDTIDIYRLRVLWSYDAELADTGGRVRIDLFQEGVDSFHTGALVNSVITRVDTSETVGAGGYIKWWNFDLSTVAGFNGFVPGAGFWIGITQLDTFTIDAADQVAPTPYGISPGGAGDGHNYYLNVPTSTLTQSGGRLFINVLTRPAVNPVPPGPVASLAARRGAALANDIVLTWLPVTNANGYKVYRMTLPTDPIGSGTLLTTLPISGLPAPAGYRTYTDVGAAALGTKFFYQVVAVN
jgi:hypothetical protein